MSSNSVILKTEKIDSHLPFEIAYLSLNRPEKANSLNGEMIELLNKSLLQIHNNSKVRLVVLNAYGKYFSAGADLKWMKESKDLSYQDNFNDSASLFDCLEKLKSLKPPTVAVVQGPSFGGALGLIACCDISIYCFYSELLQS